MTRRFAVVEKREELKQLKEDETESKILKRLTDHRYDLNSFEGRISFAPLTEDGFPDYYETLEIKTNEVAEYNLYNLGKIYLITISEEA
jgi:hypothetical protein